MTGPWFEMVVPSATAAPICALMVIVTVPPAGMLPFQVTPLVVTSATAVPLVADALVTDSVAGRLFTNSWPKLSRCANAPVLARIT